MLGWQADKANGQKRRGENENVDKCKIFSYANAGATIAESLIEKRVSRVNPFIATARKHFY